MGVLLLIFLSNWKSGIDYYKGFLYVFQQVRVEAKEKGFLINVLTESSCPGLLVFILEAFEELGLDVLQARVSCSSSFHLEAIGGKVRDQSLFVFFFEKLCTGI